MFLFRNKMERPRDWVTVEFIICNNSNNEYVIDRLNEEHLLQLWKKVMYKYSFLHFYYNTTNNTYFYDLIVYLSINKK